MSKINDIFRVLIELNRQEVPEGIDANKISRQLGIDRSTASRYLNELVRQDKAVKIPGKPVKYRAKPFASPIPDGIIPKVGVGKSMEPILEQAMAAFLYPTRSLPILLTGETGTGKTYLAETLSKLARQHTAQTGDLPFVAFNCADYAQNAELLVGQIFGIKEGAFTGATRDQEGLVEQADGGILFLDEIHRLPPSGQEMLFYLMDKGVYRRLGEAIRTRQANVTLIGATTEDPEKVLLPTLYRRFSVKLNLPPLRERTREEREVLINHFLAEEAGKMDQALAITDNSREAFLSYPCPGNIGQLKSDIQIACAHAYMRYLKNSREKVLITAEDLPDEVRIYATRSSKKKQIQTIDGSENKTRTGEDNFRLPNIYRYLANQPDQSRLQDVIRAYIKELSQRYHQPHTPKQGWQQLIDKDLFQALTRASHELKSVFPVEPDLNQLYVIGLHLQNYRNHQKQQTNKEALPIVIHPNVAYRQAAEHLANYLQKEIGLELPNEEVELIAHFLPDEHKQAVKASGQSVAIILVTHGEAAASSMADVTNTLLGNNVIHAIDMPLHLSATAIYDRVREKIKSFTQMSGVLLLVDIGSLITLGDTIQHDVDIPVKTLSCVNLPMVLEAGRKSLVTDSLDDIYHAAKKALTAFARENEAEKNIKKKRMIATVCFTGEGAAQLLESWIKDQLSVLDQDVIIRTVRIDPTTKDTAVLNDLKNYYDMIAIIGTVPVSIKGIPYIPAWELLQQDGITRLTKLLEVTRKTSGFPKTGDVPAGGIFELAVQGLGEIVTYINPKTMALLLNRHLPSIRNFYSWDTERELGMWMHLGSLIDRIVSAQLKNDNHRLTASIPLDGNMVIADQEKKIWEPLLTAIEETFSITIPDSIEKELIKLSR
ncbi:MAG: sigma 54-interacting transcriptional regulator [Thermoactinomyces sp.]